MKNYLVTITTIILLMNLDTFVRNVEEKLMTAWKIIYQEMNWNTWFYEMIKTVTEKSENLLLQVSM